MLLAKKVSTEAPTHPNETTNKSNKNSEHNNPRTMREVTHKQPVSILQLKLNKPDLFQIISQKLTVVFKKTKNKKSKNSYSKSVKKQKLTDNLCITDKNSIIKKNKKTLLSKCYHHYQNATVIIKMLPSLSRCYHHYQNATIIKMF